MKRFWKWCRLPDTNHNATRVEVTKDYFSDEDPHINKENGWTKVEEHYIDVEVEDGEKGSE